MGLQMAAPSAAERGVTGRALLAHEAVTDPGYRKIAWSKQEAAYAELPGVVVTGTSAFKLLPSFDFNLFHALC